MSVLSLNSYWIGLDWLLVIIQYSAIVAIVPIAVKSIANIYILCVKINSTALHSLCCADVPLRR